MYCRRLVGFAMGFVLLSGCVEKPQPDYTKQMLEAAVSETGQIPDMKDRFRRYLNVADAQMFNEELTEARQTLATAESELRSAKWSDADEKMHLAGWISLSQLYSRAYWDSNHGRYIDDNSHSKRALDEAVSMLNAIEPEYQRAYYVRSIAAQMREVGRGVDANKLLVQGAQWAGGIKNMRERRRGYRAIAGDLFESRDVPDAVAVLRNDSDPGWRTDAIVAITTPREYYRYRTPFLKREDLIESQSPGLSAGGNGGQQEDFGAKLDYQSNFAQQLGQDQQQIQTQQGN